MLAFFIEHFKVSGGLISQQMRLFTRPFNPEKRNKRRLSCGFVLAGTLADFGGVPFDIQKIVGDLERQPDIVRIMMQCLTCVAGCPAHDRPHFAGDRDQRAGLHTL